MLTLKSQAPAQRKSIMATALFYFFKTFNQKSPAKQGSCERKICEVNTAIANMDSRWPARRLEYAAQIIVNALKEKKENKFSHGGMSRQEVQDAARLHIGDTGLLDYVLKSMNNVIVGIPEPLPVPALAPGADVYSDVVYLYTNVLLGYPESELVELATRAILDSKHFVKEWPFKDEDDQFLRFICRLMPSSRELKYEFTRGLVVVTDIEDMEGMEDEEASFIRTWSFFYSTS
ncbi:hypothetical protein ACSBR1_043943 (mitochondrion) [Camellia fascicularis]